MRDDVFIGVDGGGTHARAVVVDAGGGERARVTGPAGLVDPRDAGSAAAVVAALARSALREAGATAAAGLCCGLAGAGRAQEREAIRVALTLEHVAERILVIGDAEAAMADAFPDGAGVLVVAGTGSIAWTRAPDGATVRVGGWGQFLGDEGSGYAIAVAALRAVARAADGRAPATSLREAVLRELRMDGEDELIPWAASATKGAYAALTPAVLACAAQGDAAAAAIRAEAVRQIAELAVTAARRSATAAPVIALSGGLIAPNGPLRADVVPVLARELPGSTILERAVDAALGAARLAAAAVRSA